MALGEWEKLSTIQLRQLRDVISARKFENEITKRSSVPSENELSCCVLKMRLRASTKLRNHLFYLSNLYLYK